MHDFHCRHADEIYSKVLADRVRQLKETEEGVDEMCAEMDQLYREGEARGLVKGIAQGRAAGLEEGMEKGIEKGMERGVTRGILAMIESLREFNIPDRTILAKIQEKFQLTAEQANDYLKMECY